MKKRKRRPRRFYEPLAPEAESVTEVLASLSDNQREILRLKFTEEKGYVQIANETGASLEEVGRIIYRVFHRLKQFS